MNVKHGAWHEINIQVLFGFRFALHPPCYLSNFKSSSSPPQVTSVPSSPVPLPSVAHHSVLFLTCGLSQIQIWSCHILLKIHQWNPVTCKISEFQTPKHDVTQAHLCSLINSHRSLPHPSHWPSWATRSSQSILCAHTPSYLCMWLLLYFESLCLLSRLD